MLGEGWDSVAILVNDSIVFRIPKRPAVARQMANEVRVLDVIRPYVSVRIPLIEWIGQPHGRFTVSAVGYRKLTGTPLSAIPPGATRDDALRRVGCFLGELHGIPTSTLNDADVPRFRWTGDNSPDGSDGWETGLQAFMERIIADVVPLLDPSTGERVSDGIAAFLGEAQHFSFHPVLIHGDLSPEHILVDSETGEISVIDFGDSGIGDPAYDVGPELLPWYGCQVDESFRARQRFYRRLAPFHGVLHGLATGDVALVAEGLRQVVEEFGG
ncbi:phosphotransferase family protein [Alicyclobacillus tolerans]|uniref:phosphotransferase family protein n=1 Tax=Alicyclobacillus tolerans TaxID=90970 RepID=UPI003B790264